MADPTEIAIVGAGFSGTLVAVHLLRQAESPLTVYLIERDPRRFARGVAYGTVTDCHLLNVPAGNMSAFSDDPEHFLRWAKAREKSLINPPWVTEIKPTSFLPRRAYGDYLGDMLDEAEQVAGSRVRLVRRLDKAVGVRVETDGARLRLLRGEALRVQKIVLALGNFPPADLGVDNMAFYQSPRYHADPWAPELLADLLETESCLLLGSGLTMVDWAVTLSQAGYRGAIHVVSRRGLWPQAHRAGSPVPFAIDPNSPPQSARAWLCQIRDYIRSHACDWRPVIDALRPHNQILWKSLPLKEQRRFLRHLRPLWDCHRHRIAPGVAERLAVLVESGQVIRHIGRILDYRETRHGVDVSIRRRGSTETDSFRIGAVVNCSGSESDYRNLESIFVRDLLDQGLIHPDGLRLGLDVDPDGALIGSDGLASSRLYTLGPPQKGALWETTAVPEVRGQAARLAEVLLGGLHRRSDDGVEH